MSQEIVNIRVQVLCSTEQCQAERLDLVRRVAETLDMQNERGIYNRSDVQHHFVSLSRRYQNRRESTWKNRRGRAPRRMRPLLR